jgi:protein SCO1/2
MCAPCHTIGGGAHVGPDLRGVSDRRDHDWLTRFIMDPAKVLARKDPDAVALAAKFPGVRMPLMGLGETDADDVLAFIRAETTRLSTSAHNAPAPK